MKIDLDSLARSRAGDRCFFLGNGPSVNALDLSLLARETIWATNRAYLLFDRISWRPSYYVIKDPHVIRHSAHVMNSLRESLPETIFFYPRWARESGTIEDGANVCWFHEVDKAETAYPQFSFDPRAGVVRSCTVATVVLQLAVWMGFNPIILLGCDMNYRSAATSDRPVFTSPDGSDSDHFDPRYLDGGTWEPPDVEGMLAELAAAREACDACGVTVLNATAGGRLEVFPRVHYPTDAEQSDDIY